MKNLSNIIKFYKQGVEPRQILNYAINREYNSEKTKTVKTIKKRALLDYMKFC